MWVREAQRWQGLGVARVLAWRIWRFEGQAEARWGGGVTEVAGLGLGAVDGGVGGAGAAEAGAEGGPGGGRSTAR